MQWQRSRQWPEEVERDGAQVCTVSHDRKPDTQPRDGYQHCHSLLYLFPTVSPPQPCNHLGGLDSHSSSSYRKYVIEIEVEEGLSMFCCWLFFTLLPSHRFGLQSQSYKENAVVCHSVIFSVLTSKTFLNAAVRSPCSFKCTQSDLPHACES